MRFYNQPRRFYYGIDLHARTMHVCVLDAAGTVVCDRNLPCHCETLLQAIAPFRDGIVIGVECMWAFRDESNSCSRSGLETNGLLGRIDWAKMGAQDGFLIPIRKSEDQIGFVDLKHRPWKLTGVG